MNEERTGKCVREVEHISGSSSSDIGDLNVEHISGSSPSDIGDLN